MAIKLLASLLKIFEYKLGHTQSASLKKKKKTVVKYPVTHGAYTVGKHWKKR